MNYQQLGNTGLKVSSLCLGTMTFGDGADAAESERIYKSCRDAGINFFDCADVYAGGESERILGKLIRRERDKVIVSTKAFYPTSDDPNDRGLGRRHLTNALDRSLANLGTDYIDIYYLHSFDIATPLEESLTTLGDFIRRGKILYVGVSNFAAWQVMKAKCISAGLGSADIACIQPMYNLLKRQCESELLPMARSESIGVVPYSPLAGGLLTGKYFDESKSERRFDASEMYQKRYADPSYKRIVEQFVSFANEIGIHPISLAIAWVMTHPAVTSPIIGARTLKQLGPSLDAIDVKISAETRVRISGFSRTPPIATDRDEERL